MCKKIKDVLKKELMLTVAVVAAIASLFITPPTMALVEDIDWKTLATLFMMLCVLEGFKKEHIFNPLLKFAGNMHLMRSLTLFLVFCVFFSSMFVTNDVSLIIFVPLTIILFRAGGKEKYILPVLTFENIAAVRGSMLMPFGSPQNLFLFSQSGVSAPHFMLHMLPLSAFSGVLLILFICFLYRKNLKEEIVVDKEEVTKPWDPTKKKNRIFYLILFTVVITTIVSRTTYWPYVLGTLILAVLVFDRKNLLRVDYVLLFTFLCFFVFSSSIAANEKIAAFLSKTVAGHEYLWSILISQVISNVPASIVLWPFTTNLAGLIYGLDSAGLCTLIGSLASVINYRIYVREYPGQGGKFILYFTCISLAFFAIVVIPGYLLSAWPF